MFSYLPRHIQGDFLMPLHATISKWKARLISLSAVGWLIIYGIGSWFSYLYGGFLSCLTYLVTHSAYGYCNHTVVYCALHLGIPLLIPVLSSLNGVQWEAYHMQGSVMCSPIPQQCQRFSVRGQTMWWGGGTTCYCQGIALCKTCQTLYELVKFKPHWVEDLCFRTLRQTWHFFL